MQAPNTMPTMPTTRPSFASRLPPVPPPRPLYESTQSTLPTLPGYYVSSEDEIVPGNVPMDNSISFFPSKDLSRIFIRQWNKQGELEHLTYVVEQPKAPATPVELEKSSTMEQKREQEESALVNTLNSLNNGLAMTFNQFGATLQSMQRSIDDMNERIQNLPDGGMG